MNNTREHLYLAALLHDIGKFYQLACSGENSFCDVEESTQKFFHQKEAVIKKVLKAGDFVVTEEMHAFIVMAELYASGIHQQDVNVKNSRPSYTKLHSIFNNILVNGEKAEQIVGFSLSPLDLRQRTLFPSIISSEDDISIRHSYMELWELFNTEFDYLPCDSFRVFVESLIFLLKKYTWCIPANSTKMANISLFEHMKTTAAFADCLYQYRESNPDEITWDNINKRLVLRNSILPVMLVGCDLSGIQKFIYDIPSAKAAVSMKGRSFYLQLMIDSMIHRILSHSQVQATIGNVVYSSGGKFYLLLPFVEHTLEALNDLRIEFEQEVWAVHQGLLSVALEYIPFCFDTKSGEVYIGKTAIPTVGQLWKELADRLAMEKSKKFRTLLQNDYDKCFTPISVGSKFKVCAVTGIESPDCVLLDNDEEHIFVLPIVKQQAQLGNVLKDVDYIYSSISSRGVDAVLAHKYKITILGVDHYFYSYDDLKSCRKRNSSATYGRLMRVNDTTFIENMPELANTYYGFQFYGGNKQALNTKNQMKTFEQLANDSYLGVLRLDVDNLGSIFISGIPDTEKSFVTYATVSFLLDMFFSGYLNTIRNSSEYKDDVNIIYSGGDDIFAVGRWDHLILFAQQIRNEFEKFVGRCDISISGGVSIIGSKFPIGKAALMAGEAEKSAKSFRNREKNAINLFGASVSWNREFEIVCDWRNDFVERCSDKLPRSILHRIMRLNEIRNDGDPKYVWHTVYSLTRFSERHEQYKPFVSRLLKALLEDPRQYELIALAARWAELILREILTTKK